MKEYKKPIVEVIEFSMEDVITTSGGTGSDTETPLVPFGAPRRTTLGNINSGSNWQ